MSTRFSGVEMSPLKLRDLPGGSFKSTLGPMRHFRKCYGRQYLSNLISVQFNTICIKLIKEEIVSFMAFHILLVRDY